MCWDLFTFRDLSTQEPASIAKDGELMVHFSPQVHRRNDISRTKRC